LPGVTLVCFGLLSVLHSKPACTLHLRFRWCKKVPKIQDTYWRKLRPLGSVQGRVGEGFIFATGVRVVLAGGGSGASAIEELSGDNRGQDSAGGNREDCDHSRAGAIRVRTAGTDATGIESSFSSPVTRLQSNIDNSNVRELFVGEHVIVQNKLDSLLDNTSCLSCVGAIRNEGEDNNGAAGGSGGRVRDARVCSWVGKMK
jgi:hypothetical protein